MPDVTFIHPGAQAGIYGPLANGLTALEPPTWTRMIAGYIRDRGFSVSIIDAEAEGLDAKAITARVMHDIPSLIVIVVSGHQPSASTQQMIGASAAATMLRNYLPAVPIMMAGNHPSALPERTLREEKVNFVCDGEGPITIEALLRREVPYHQIPGLVWWFKNEVMHNPTAPLIDDLAKDLHGDVWDLLPMNRYRAHTWQCFGDLGKRQPYASIYTTLGCPHKCLAGDTRINTPYGMIPIKELAERFPNGAPVFTFDPVERRAFVATATDIKRYGVGETLVRVAFDDGSYIDCTPDHRFLAFKWGNQHAAESQLEVEASDLKPGLHVRAIKETVASYPVTNWSRRGRMQTHRLVAEWKIGRRLTDGEQVHHIDHNKLNFQPDNLEVFSSGAAHFREHGEISERMRNNNPAKNMTPEWRENIRLASTGRHRSLEQRLHYSESKRGTKNPNYKHGLTVGRSSRLPAVNHRVVSVTSLEGKHDVYCLNVAETGWFYANNVLVHNCSFCMINVFQHGNHYRRFAPEFVVGQIKKLHDVYGISTIKIADELFILSKPHYTAICKGIIEAGLGDKLNIWAYARVDTVHPENLDLLRRAGVRWLALGIESGSKHVRDGADKALRNEDIVGVVRAIQTAGINVIGNYIFGLPDDDMASMQATLDLAIECNTEFGNFYSAMAYPGSKLYENAIRAGAGLPQTWGGYSQHNSDCRPLDTEHVGGREVLQFRDEAFLQYFQRPAYLAMIEKRFGAETVEHVKQMASLKLKRNILGPP